MSISQKYKAIFNKEILQQSKGVIFAFSPQSEGYTYQPYSHAISETSVENLGALMRKNMLFYTYGEDEVVNYVEKNTFHSMEQAAKYAYRQRLPERTPKQDGLPSEVLLDLLIQIYNPSAYKLAVRTIFRQKDNNEIKGYDLTYFVKDHLGITLWLGQAKLGGLYYCKSGINEDLNKKFTPTYLTEQLFFICDKRVSLTDDAREILSIIEEINIREMESDSSVRAKTLLQFFQDNNIRIKIPCLLAYDKEDVYNDPAKLYEKINDEVESMKKYYCTHSYSFSGFVPEIVFYIFPVESVDRLRSKETGFYAGLC